MRIFIDANIYLKYVLQNKEEQKPFDDLEKLLKDEKTFLIFPDITYQEVQRNLPGKINAEKPNKPYAVSLAPKELIAEYNSVLKKLEENFNKIISEFRNRVEKLKGISIPTPETDELLHRAHFRKLKNNPPGKGSAIGDELSWEILLKFCSDDDLIIVTGDPDWRDKSKKELVFHPIIETDWKNKSEKKLILFDTLTEALKLLGVSGVSLEKIEKEREKPFIIDTTPVPYAVSANFTTPSGTATISPSGPYRVGGVSYFSPSPYISPSCLVCGNPRDRFDHPLCFRCRDHIE